MKKRLCAIIGSCFFAFSLGKLIEFLVERVRHYKKISNDFSNESRILYQWLALKQNGVKLGDRLKELGYHKVALYGMNELGICLLNELKANDIEVSYAIDKSGFCVDNLIKTYGIQEQYDSVDAVIICVLPYLEEVRSELSTRIDCPLIAIDQLFFIN